MLAAFVPTCAFVPSANMPRAGNVVWVGMRDAVCARQRPAIASLSNVAVLPGGVAAGEGAQDEKDTLKIKSGSTTLTKTRVTTVDEFRKVVSSGQALTSLEVVGDTERDLSQSMHPVLEVLAQRRTSGSKPMQRQDGYKIALAIEGGGMRGCVAAGMVAALHDAGLGDCFVEVVCVCVCVCV